MDRYWLLTWTTYGTWLPGDERGSVSNVADATGRGVRYNAPGQPAAVSMPTLRAHAASNLVSDPARLLRPQAEAVCEQFRDTAAYRGWELLAVAVMANHVHMVVAVNGDPDPSTLLRDFKSYSSRRLNREFGNRERWWTQSGSTRKLRDEAAVRAAVEYVRGQEYPLVMWVRDGERPA